MNCKECTELLQLYHDGELSGKRRSEFESHLAECPECQALLAEFSSLDALIKDGEAEKVPDPGKHYWHSFSHRITRRLATHRPTIRPRHARTRPFRFGLIPYLSAGAAIVLALVVSLTMLRQVPTRFTEEEASTATTETDEAGLPVPTGPPESPETMLTEDLGEGPEIAFGAVIEDKTEGIDDKGLMKAEEARISLPRADTDVEPGAGYVTSDSPKDGLGAAESEEAPATTGKEKDGTRDEEGLDNQVRAGFFDRSAKNVAEESPVLSESMRFQTPFSPPPGTLKVVVDSLGQLVNVTIKSTSGNPEADSAAIKAYETQWAGQTFRQRRAMLLVPFEETETSVESNK